MNLEQVGLQLGIAGLMLVAGYRIALVLINNWRATEKERTEALTVGLSSIGDKVERHAQADLKSHSELTDRVSRFEGKLDALLEANERTPVTPLPRVASEPHGFYSLTPAKKER